jgi:hypothetical protein
VCVCIASRSRTHSSSSSSSCCVYIYTGSFLFFLLLMALLYSGSISQRVGFKRRRRTCRWFWMTENDGFMAGVSFIPCLYIAKEEKRSPFLFFFVSVCLHRARQRLIQMGRSLTWIIIVSVYTFCFFGGWRH